MRIDKFLKTSRIIKRRTIAREACDAGRVTLNGRTAKPGSVVAVGDVIEVAFANRTSRYEVVSLSEATGREQSAAMVREL
jgi:ribosomal 50S subunit-recycling heat shock protein